MSSRSPLTPDSVLEQLADLGPKGADFRLARDGVVRLATDGHEILVDRPGVQPITRAELAIALEYVPLRRVRDLPRDRLHGVSYLFALLRDPRIVGPDQPDPTFPIAVADAKRAETALGMARDDARQAQTRRDEAVWRASLRGATNRQLAGALGITAEAIGQIISRSKMALWRVRAACGSARPAPEFLSALGPIGEVVLVSTFHLSASGAQPGPVVVDIPAATADDAVAEVVEVLATRLDLALHADQITVEQR